LPRIVKAARTQKESWLGYGLCDGPNALIQLFGVGAVKSATGR
jgi:hypothetical protein